MNFNITTLAASIHGSIVILCLETIIVIVSIPLLFDAGAALRCLSAYTLTEVTLAP